MAHSQYWCPAGEGTGSGWYLEGWVHTSQCGVGRDKKGCPHGVQCLVARGMVAGRTSTPTSPALAERQPHSTPHAGTGGSSHGSIQECKRRPLALATTHTKCGRGHHHHLAYKAPPVSLWAGLERAYTLPGPDPVSSIGRTIFRRKAHIIALHQNQLHLRPSPNTTYVGTHTNTCARTPLAPHHVRSQH